MQEKGLFILELYLEKKLENVLLKVQVGQRKM